MGHPRCHYGASKAGERGRTIDLELPRVSSVATVATLTACGAAGHRSQAGHLVSIGIFSIVLMKGFRL